MSAPGDAIPSDPREQAILVSEARSGSREALDLLFLHFDSFLRVYLLRRAGSKLARDVTTDDLVQDVYTRMLRAVVSLREGAVVDDVRGLLIQHARWVLTDRGRQAASFVGESVAGIRAPGSEPSAPFVNATANDCSMGPVTLKDMRYWVRSLVDRLPCRYAEVMRPYLEGRPFSEIAAELGIEEATVRKRFTRATQKLREMRSDRDPR